MLLEAMYVCLFWATRFVGLFEEIMSNFVLGQRSNLAVSLFPSMLTEAKVFIPNGLYSDTSPSDVGTSDQGVPPPAG